MKPVRITCDSACDLPQALQDRYRIRELPLQVQLGKSLQQDKVEVDAEALYRFSSRTGLLPEIRPLSVSRYRDFFLECLREDCQVLHICPSARLSQCWSHARAAAQGLPDVAVVDSESIAAGAGQLALLAAELAGADYSLEDLIQALNEMKKHLDVSCILKSSRFLRKKGRPGGLQAFGEDLLNLRPELCLKEGCVRRGKPFRGDMDQAVLSYVESRVAGRRNIQTDRIFVTYSGMPEGLMARVRNLLQQLQPFEQIVEIPAAGAVSGRCGPGSLGLAFMTT